MPEENLHGPGSDPDAPLVRRAQRGDRLAFERLVDRHQHRLFTLAARTLGSRNEAEDAVQEAFLRAWRNLGSFRGDALFSTWLYRICVNAAHDLRERRVPEPVEVDRHCGRPARPLRRPRALGRAPAGARGARRRPAQDSRAVRRPRLLLRGGRRRSLDVAEGTVKSRLFRARRELAQRLGTRRRDPGVEGMVNGARTHPDDLELLDLRRGRPPDGARRADHRARRALHALRARGRGAPGRTRGDPHRRAARAERSGPRPDHRGDQRRASAPAEVLARAAPPGGGRRRRGPRARLVRRVDRLQRP